MIRTHFKPLYDRVLVKERPAPEKTKSGLFLPDAMKAERPNVADVIAVGAGKVIEDGRVIPLAIRVGNVVLYGKYAGTDIVLDEVGYKILREDEVAGVVTFEELPDPVVETPTEG